MSRGVWIQDTSCFVFVPSTAMPVSFWAYDIVHFVSYCAGSLESAPPHWYSLVPGTCLPVCYRGKTFNNEMACWLHCCCHDTADRKTHARRTDSTVFIAHEQQHDITLQQHDWRIKCWPSCVHLLQSTTSSSYSFSCWYSVDNVADFDCFWPRSIEQ